MSGRSIVLTITFALTVENQDTGLVTALSLVEPPVEPRLKGVTVPVPTERYREKRGPRGCYRGNP
jgi:hypothetical protein